MKKFLKSPFGIGLTTFILTILVFISAKAVGFNIGSGLTITRSGSINITDIKESDVIFLDSKEKNNSPRLRNVSPGQHTILIARDNHWPWAKSINIGSSEEIYVAPFFVSKNASGLIIPNSDNEYYSLRNKIINETLPKDSDKKISKSGNVAIWVEENKIFAEWLGEESLLPQYFCFEEKCETIIEVLDSQTKIRNLDFYIDREDVLLLSSEIGVYALEIDKRGVQNFQPLYKGISLPMFLIEDVNTLYILDGNVLFMVNI